MATSRKECNEKVKRIIKKRTLNEYILFLFRKGYFNLLSDKHYLKLLFRLKMGYKLNLKNLNTFNEKLQWLKLYNRNPEYGIMADKLSVKHYVANSIGEQYIIPTLGVWEKFDDIDFRSLPDQFVLKCTHDSGGLVICKDKDTLDIAASKKKIERALKRNFYKRWREWPYKDVPRKIIAEKYITDSPTDKDLTDYKFFCFNGIVDCVMIAIERSTGEPKFYFFDNDWKLLRLNVRGKNAPPDFTLPKPKCIDEMFRIAEVLSKGIPFVRVDLYQSNDKVYFGEMTFFPQSGFDSNLLPETDLYFGELIDIKEAKSK